jgi:MraZ protein
MDEKGRVSLPSAFRREASGDRFVLLQWRAPALTLFPASSWATTQERLLAFRRNQPEAWGDVLAITSSAVEVSPDKQGRILIPSWLQEAAGLEEKVLLLGNIDRVELWHPAEFERVARTGSAEFHKFSNQIFG